MPFSQDCRDIYFDGPATYRITVKGRIDASYFENLGGMHVTVHGQSDEIQVTILTGEVKDQAELMGILDGLYMLHMPILSLEKKSGKERVEK